MVETWKRSGQTVNTFCHARQLTRSNLDRRRRILAIEAGTSHPSPPPTFVPLRVVTEPMTEIVLPSGVEVRVPLGAAADALHRLVAAVVRSRVDHAAAVEFIEVPDEFAAGEVGSPAA